MSATGSYSILNVDDDEAGRYAKSRILKRAGYEVIEAGTGTDALRLVSESAPQLVLLDVKLPDISGMDVCRKIKENPLSSHVMVLQISASHVTTPDRVLGLACGADTYLTEPVESTELLATVQALLRLYKREEENRHLLAQLQEADRRKDDFLATLAHELRNPLHPIRGAVELLQPDRQLDPEVQISRDVIVQQVNHLARLIEDLLDVGRITRDKLEMRKESLLLNDVLSNAIESSRAFLEAHGHQAIVTFPEEAVQIEADPARLTQIFMNLLNNAAKYTPKGERIWFNCRTEGDRAVISVKDSGVGIASDQLPHVFDKFYQIDHSLERSESGLGLGLTLARRLVELHGGTIEARSDGLGKGTEITVWLPILTKPEPLRKNQSPKVETASGNAHWRVLIIDDGARTREMYSILLRKHGHEVETAPDGRTGIELVKSFHPDVVLLDVGMPRLNGFDACAQIRDLPGGKNIIMIAVTGWAKQDVQQRADESGFDGILVKPASVQQILQLAESLLESKKVQNKPV